MVIEKTLRAVVLAGVFALPFIVFIVAQSLFFPFITGKNFTFRIIVEIMTGAYLALALANPIYRPKRTWLLAAFAIFVVVVALADAFGAYPFKSFWSNYERMDGWVTLAHLFCYFVVVSSVLNTEKLWRTFWHVSLGVSVIVGLYGFLQLLGFASLNPGFSSVSRIDATFGNPIYLAVYMLFHIGIAAMLWAHTWESGMQRRRVGFSILYGGIILFNTFILFMTGTRGTMLGLLGGALLAALLIAISSERARRTALLGVMVVVIIAGGFWSVREQAWVQRIPFLQRLATISLDDNTTKARFYNWGMAWEGVKERPLLGWGQENYAVVFDKHYDPRMYAQEQWFDRVHNVVFDWLVAAGFLGLLSYLGIVGTALYLLWCRGTRAFSVLERSILAGTIAAYFFHNLFVFDNITSYTLFVSILAYIAWRAGADSPSISLPSISPKFLPVAAIAAACLVWGVAWFVNGHALAANRALLQALAQQPEGLQKNIEFFREAIAYESFGTQEAREQFTQLAAQIVRVDGVPFETKQAVVVMAVNEMSAMAEASPLNARFPLFIGALLGAAGDHPKAIQALQRAHELSPGKQTILFELASNMFANGNVPEALATYKKAFELDQSFVEARLFYAASAIRAREDALADELLKPVIETGKAADPRIAAAYVSRGRYDKIVDIWEEHVVLNPEDARAHFTLAAAYFGAGSPSAAIFVLEKLGAVVPAAKEQADALIEQIRNGTASLDAQ